MPLLQKDLGNWSPWGKYMRTRARIYKLLNDEIEDRRANQEFGNDVLSLLLASEDEDGQALSNEVLQDELMTMLFAGHETTASTVSWAFYWIHQRPEVKDKLLAELNDLPENASLMDMAKLPYLDAVCNETLRIQPVVLFTFGRVLTEDVELVGETIPANTMVAPCIYLAHYNPEIFPNPERFNPDRFLNHTYSPYEFIPFGGGNRRCLGYAFAQFEMKVILATILKRYSLELVSQEPIKSARRGITMMPSNGVPMRLVA